MHKKHKLHKLHSIPIGLCKNRYLVSYSIPLACAGVLLLGFTMIVNPDHFVSQKSYAIETGESSESSEEGSNSMARVAPTSTIALNVTSDTNDGYGNDVAGQVTTAPGAGTAYRSHKVTVTGSNILSYDLKISGPTNLTPSSDTITTVVGGAGGKTGAEMSSSNSNIWGYAWGQNADAVEEMTYNTMSTSGSNLSCDSPSNYNVSCERKLVFGANFNTAANPGTYTASVTLALTSTPAEVTYSLVYNANGGSNPPATQTQDSTAATHTFTIAGQGSMTRANYSFLGWSTDSTASAADSNYAPGKTVTLTKVSNQSKTLYAVWKANTMQGITRGFCKNNSNISTGTTFTLKDSRDDNTYNIVKLKDGQCWMQENLRLPGDTTLKPSDSDVSSDWTLPASSDSSWSSTNTVAQMRTGKSGMTVSSGYPGDGNGWQSSYGNYYSWCAATAGTCSEYTNDGGNVSGSICPKNWHLPTGKSGGEFYTLLNGLSNTTVIGSPYNYPYAGFIFTGGLRTPGTDGYYWSSTSSSSSNAYALYFGSNGVFGPGASNGTRYFGYSVRCVADY